MRDDIEITGTRFGLFIRKGGITKPLHLSARGIEAEVSHYHFYRAECCEREGLPPFVWSFYNYLHETGRICHDDAFFQRYLSDNGAEVSGNKVRLNGLYFPSDGIEARVRRNYASYLRELHFLVMIHESGFFDAVKYSYVQDMNGIDISVLYAGVWYQVRLYTKTRNAIAAAGRKLTKHKDLNAIDIPTDFSLCKLIGTYYLYTETTVRQLADTIKTRSKEMITEKLLNIQQALKAPKGQYNEFGKYNYRSCEDILEAVKPLLAKENVVLTITDTITEVGGRVYVQAKATLTDCAGDGNIDTISVTGFAREEESKKGMDSSQVTGAASSYARKYALNGLFCIDDNKDSDATNTHGKEEKKTAQKPEEKPKPKPEEKPDPLVIRCECCGNPIMAREHKGKRFSVDEIVDSTRGKYGKALCWDCAVKANES